MFARCRNGHVHWGTYGAAGLLLARRGTVLLQLRAGWTMQGGTWSVPGGAIERGESALDAALREAEEELGIDAEAVTVRDSYLAVCGGWTYETVLAEPLDGVRTSDTSESAGHAWVPLDEVDELPLHSGFRAAWDHPGGALRDFVAGTAA